MKRIVSRVLLHDTRRARATRRDAALAATLELVSRAELESTVRELSFARSRLYEPQANAAAASWIAHRLRQCGYEVTEQGPYRNLIALPRTSLDRGFVLVGAHYDSVANCPGADDNASGVAALLCCARLLAAALPVVLVAFNAEEEGLLGSSDFADNWLAEQPYRCLQAHVLEMLGCTAAQQRVPDELPLELPPCGDFISWLGDMGSARTLSSLASLSAAYVPRLHGVGLKVPALVARRLQVLLRSDHTPLWDMGVPAVLWTDTADFRNHRYHTPLDLPETLDYHFLEMVTRLLLASVMIGGRVI